MKIKIRPQRTAAPPLFSFYSLRSKKDPSHTHIPSIQPPGQFSSLSRSPGCNLHRNLFLYSLKKKKNSKKIRKTPENPLWNPFQSKAHFAVIQAYLSFFVSTALSAFAQLTIAICETEESQETETKGTFVSTEITVFSWLTWTPL